MYVLLTYLLACLRSVLTFRHLSVNFFLVCPVSPVAKKIKQAYTVIDLRLCFNPWLV